MITAPRAYTAAAIGGALLWQITAMLSGRREAWDSPMYWVLAYPAGLVIAGVIAYLHPFRAWRFALAMMWIQPVVMAVTSDSDFGLLPLGLITFGILALPPIGIAALVSANRRRKESLVGPPAA